MHGLIVDSLLVMAGVCFWTALHHFFAGIAHGDRRHLFFTGIALAAVVAEINLMVAYEAMTVSAVSTATRWSIHATLAITLLLPWFVADVLGTWRFKWIGLSMLLSLTFIVANALLPHGLQYESIQGLRRIEPFQGAALTLPHGVQSPWFLPASVFLLSLMATSAYLLLRKHRTEPGGPCFGLAMALLVWMATMLQGILVRMGLIDFIHLGPYGYMAMIVMMSIVLNRDARDRIQTSERRFRSLFQQAPLSMVLLSPKGRIRQANQAFEKLWGVSSQQIQGLDILEDRQLRDKGITPYIERAIRGEAVEAPPIVYNPAESAQIKGPERDRIVRAFIYPVADETNGISEVIVIHDDITERKRAEEQVIRSEKRLKAVTDHLPAMVAYWSSDLRCIFANPAFTSLCSRGGENVVGKHIRDVMGEATYLKHTVHIQRALNGEVQEFDCQLVNPAGESRDYWAQYVPENSDGQITGIYALVTDVTDLKQALSSLRMSEQRFRSIYEHIPIGLALVDRKTGVYLSANMRYLEILGHAATDLGQLNFSEIPCQPDGSGDVHLIKHARPDGQQVSVRLSTTPAGDEASLQFIAIAEDITEDLAREERERRLAAQLLQATKMEAIGHLTGGIAHDFNNILGALMGYADLAQLALSKETPSGTVQRYLGEILMASQRAKELIAQMMLFSRGETARLGEDTACISLHPMLKEVIALLRASMPATKALNLSSAEHDLRARILPVQLHQAVLNLVINARDATDEYGRIEVTLSRQRLSGQICSSCKADINGDYVEIAVSDNGSGIPAEAMENIFTPFFTTKEIGKGSGMGLSVVHGILHAADGHIVVETAPGMGTTFRLLLPAGVKNVCEDLPTTDDERTLFSDDTLLWGRRIMIVDDEKIIVDMLEERLTQQGADVVSFTQSLAAIDAWECNPEGIDLLITDETMPGLSGMHLAARMLAKRPQLPIILCTGYSEHATPETARAAGIARFMYKPVDSTMLVRTIVELLGLATQSSSELSTRS